MLKEVIKTLGPGWKTQYIMAKLAGALILSQFTKKTGIANLCMACVGDALADAIVILIRMEPGRSVQERMNDSTRGSRVFRGLFN